MAELIVALDFNTQKAAIDLARILLPRIKWFKVGLELFISAGPAVVDKLAMMGARVFLDLKIYDIPNTAAAAARAAMRPGVGLFTVHLQGGRRMCKAVHDVLSSSNVLCAGVTALTSFSEGEMPGIGLSPSEYGLFLAKKAEKWGLGAVVCAIREAEQIKTSLPGLKLVCPGIRTSCNPEDDQMRIGTPTQPIRVGADYLVVGRPITRAEDPLEAAEEFLKEIHLAS